MLQFPTDRYKATSSFETSDDASPLASSRSHVCAFAVSTTACVSTLHRTHSNLCFITVTTLPHLLILSSN